MKKKANGSRMPLKTGLLFGLAAVLLLGGAIGTSRAALTIYSEYYSAQIQMYDIGVTLMENGNNISTRSYSQDDGSWDVSTGKLLQNMVPAGEKFQLGKPYDEVLTVRNDGLIDEYVRLTVYRYWAKTDAEGNFVDKDGNPLAEGADPVRRTDMSPKLIDLDIEEVAEANGWLIDESASTDERTVLYYSKALPGDGLSPDDPARIAPPVSGMLRIDGAAGGKMERKTEQTEDGTKTTVTYQYDKAKFVLEAEVDAVQTHSPREAIKSAWGVDADIAGDADGGDITWIGTRGN